MLGSVPPALGLSLWLGLAQVTSATSPVHLLWPWPCPTLAVTLGLSFRPSEPRPEVAPLRPVSLAPVLDPQGDPGFGPRKKRGCSALRARPLLYPVLPGPSSGEGHLESHPESSREDARDMLLSSGEKAMRPKATREGRWSCALSPTGPTQLLPHPQAVRDTQTSRAPASGPPP